MDTLKKLSLDIYNGKTTRFEKNDGQSMDANEALRGLILEKCDGKWSYNNYQKIKYDLFEILETIVTATTSPVLKEAFSDIMVWKDTALGDKPEFYVEDNKFYSVSVVADGTNNFIRQRMTDRRVPTKAFDLGLAIYEEWTPFFTGVVDFKKAIDKVILSMNHKIGTLIGQTFAKAYTGVQVDFKVTGSGGTVDKAKLIELCAKVGKDAVIYGSKLALSKIPQIESFAVDSTDVRNSGYVHMVAGIKCVELENSYDVASKTFAVENDKLFIVPNGDKVIYGGFEGDAWIVDQQEGARKDRQVEFFYGRRLHLGVAVATGFGLYEIK